MRSSEDGGSKLSLMGGVLTTSTPFLNSPLPVSPPSRCSAGAGWLVFGSFDFSDMGSFCPVTPSKGRRHANFRLH